MNVVMLCENIVMITSDISTQTSQHAEVEGVFCWISLCVLLGQCRGPPSEV